MSNSTLQEDVVTETAPPRATLTALPVPSTPAPAAAPAPVAPRPSFLHRYKKPALILAGIIAAIAIAFYAYDSFTHEETDDAYVTGHLHNVSARISEVVTDVLVDDNQYVHQGDVLVKLDPSDYLALGMAAKANVDKAQADLKREEPLVQLHAYSQQDIDAARSTLDVDLAQLKLAELQVDYATIRAPSDGYVGRKNVEIGNRVSSGQTLLVVVEPDMWVVGNFKETQLARMRIGQPVRITIDSIPDRIFDGHVDSFSPATGNEFALLPADNSTGNFTKIVQRVPVKIVFDPASTRGYETRIRAGESAIVKVALAEPAAAAPAK